jgi:hypothetical protein
MYMAIIFLLGVVCCYGAGVVREELALQKLAKAATRQHLLDLEEAYDRRVSLPIPAATPRDTGTVAYMIAQREEARATGDTCQNIKPPWFVTPDGDLRRRQWGKN